MKPKEPLPDCKIRPTDLVSGVLYLKLIEDYKAYDKEQKKLIRKLQDKLNNLSQRDPELMKYAQRHELFKSLQDTIHKLRKENEELLIRVVELQKRVTELESSAVNFVPL